MHVILVPFGSAGDVYPFVALGIELKRRGHCISMITSEYFGNLARNAGFEFTASVSSEAYLALVGDPDFWHPLRSTSLLVNRSINPAIAVIYDLLEQAYRPGESAVVAGTLALGARVAQDKLGIPLTTVHLQPSAIRSCHEPAVHPGFGWIHRLPLRFRPLAFRLIDAVADRLYAGPLNAFRATLDLPPIKRLFASWWHSPESTLALFPAWYAAPQPDWPEQISLCDFPLYDAEELESSAADLERYLAAGEPPVVFTSGSAMASADHFFAVSAEACRALDRRALFVTRFEQQLPRPLPPHVHHMSYVPFGRLLSRAAALVHHGGIGTVAQALRAGVPQLVAPCCYDQYDNAAHLQNLGVGLTIPRRQLAAPRVATALHRLLTDRAMHRRCRELAAHFGEAKEPIAKAADLLERYWFERRKMGRTGPRLSPAAPAAAAGAATAA